MTFVWSGFKPSTSTTSEVYMPGNSNPQNLANRANVKQTVLQPVMRCEIFSLKLKEYETKQNLNHNFCKTYLYISVSKLLTLAGFFS